MSKSSWWRETFGIQPPRLQNVRYRTSLPPIKKKKKKNPFFLSRQLYPARSCKSSYPRQRLASGLTSSARGLPSRRQTPRPQDGGRRGQGASEQRRGAETGDLAPARRLPHRGQHDWLRDLCVSQGMLGMFAPSGIWGAAGDGFPSNGANGALRDVAAVRDAIFVFKDASKQICTPHGKSYLCIW